MWKCASTKGGADEAAAGVDRSRAASACDAGSTAAMRPPVTAMSTPVRPSGRVAFVTRRSKVMAVPVQRWPLKYGIISALRIVGAARDHAPARRWREDRAASGRPGPARRRRPACCSRSWKASKAPKSSAPRSALPGRQEAKTVSAMQIQPRPFGHLEEEGVEGRHGQERAAERHQRRAGDDGADAERDDVEPLRLDGGRVFADRAHREAERRAVEDVGGDREQREGEEGERRLLEQRRADERAGPRGRERSAAGTARCAAASRRSAARRDR